MGTPFPLGGSLGLGKKEREKGKRGENWKGRRKNDLYEEKMAKRRKKLRIFHVSS